jgi:hypothetical protein
VLLGEVHHEGRTRSLWKLAPLEKQRGVCADKKFIPSPPKAEHLNYILLTIRSLLLVGHKRLVYESFYIHTMNTKLRF